MLFLIMYHCTHNVLIMCGCLTHLGWVCKLNLHKIIHPYHGLLLPQIAQLLNLNTWKPTLIYRVPVTSVQTVFQQMGTN